MNYEHYADYRFTGTLAAHCDMHMLSFCALPSTDHFMIMSECQYQPDIECAKDKVQHETKKKKKQVRETQLLFGLGETLGETSLQVKFV